MTRNWELKLLKEQLLKTRPDIRWLQMGKLSHPIFHPKFFSYMKEIHRFKQYRAAKWGLYLTQKLIEFVLCPSPYLSSRFKKVSASWAQWNSTLLIKVLTPPSSSPSAGFLQTSAAQNQGFNHAFFKAIFDSCSSVNLSFPLLAAVTATEIKCKHKIFKRNMVFLVSLAGTQKLESVGLISRYTNHLPRSEWTLSGRWLSSLLVPD